MKKVLILGASGMLGHSMVNEFAAFKGQVIATKRPTRDVGFKYEVELRNFNAETDDISHVAHDFGPDDFIINCIGYVKSHINENESASVRQAVSLNSLFPHRIQEFVSITGTKVIQIATDCVYNGSRGNYLESDVHDATDVYGKSKSLGEVCSSQFMNIRVSIIGPEIAGHTSLYDWVRLQPRGSKINGYTNHIWNGVPAKHFSKACLKIIEAGMFENGVHHFLPADKISKFELVRLIAKNLNRDDLEIKKFANPIAIDRSLNSNTDFSKRIWHLLGHAEAPKIQELLRELT